MQKHIKLGRDASKTMEADRKSFVFRDVELRVCLKDAKRGRHRPCKSTRTQCKNILNQMNDLYKDDPEQSLGRRPEKIECPRRKDADRLPDLGRAEPVYEELLGCLLTVCQIFEFEAFNLTFIHATRLKATD